MANHLQLVLRSLTTSPIKQCPVTNEESITLCPQEYSKFIGSLKSTGQLVLGQYDGYERQAKRFFRSSHEPQAEPAIFSATAASVDLTSSYPVWKDVRFSISAAKATGTRRVEAVITFKSNGQIRHHNDDPCTIRFIIQEATFITNPERIHVRCSGLPDLLPPAGWEIVDGEMRPQAPCASPQIWELGSAASAYDHLLWDAAVGKADKFMNVGEVLAAWTLWTPIVRAAEKQDPRFTRAAITYQVGSKNWMQEYSPSQIPKSVHAGGHGEL